jgi:hypothetical protein
LITGTTLKSNLVANTASRGLFEELPENIDYGQSKGKPQQNRTAQHREDMKLAG